MKRFGYRSTPQTRRFAKAVLEHASKGATGPLEIEPEGGKKLVIRPKRTRLAKGGHKGSHAA